MATAEDSGASGAVAVGGMAALSGAAGFAGGAGCWALTPAESRPATHSVTAQAASRFTETSVALNRGTMRILALITGSDLSPGLLFRFAAGGFLQLEQLRARAAIKIAVKRERALKVLVSGGCVIAGERELRQVIQRRLLLG